MDEMGLKKYFADLNTVLYNILNFHWNVTGGLFLTLHELYQEQYNFVFASIDQLGEILKKKDIFPLTNFKDIEDLACIKTMSSKDYSAKDTIVFEIKQFETLNKVASRLGNAFDEEGELTIVDFFTRQTSFYNKQIYFLQQFLK